MVEDKNIKEVENTNAEWLKLQETLGQGRCVIGIDIGITSVDVAQVALYKGKPTLIKTAVEAIHISHERERENVTIATLRRALSKFHTKKADIVCVLSSRQIIVEIMIMPLMPKEELFEAVHLEMMNSKRFNIENLIFDFQIAGRTIDNGIEKINVTVAAIDKSAVDNLLAKFMRQQAKPLAGLEADEKVESPVGLEVTSIIPLSIAIENIIKKSKVRTDEIVAIIEMGTMAAELNIYRNGQLELSRQLSVTGFMLSRSLMRAFFTEQGKVGLTMEEAEQIKKEYGIPSPED
ncbi:MAG TPA: pilus assembly protein PilM, partial [Candidatus Omnitrophota bacterium]|nr:pilus assembly protein PilM [Candidatus Omnitrophota bacterium]